MVTTPPPSLLGRPEFEQTRESWEGQIETRRGTRCMYACGYIYVHMNKTVCKEAGDDIGEGTYDFSN